MADAKIDVKLDVNRAIDQGVSIAKSLRGSKTVNSPAIKDMELPPEPNPEGRKDTRVGPASVKLSWDNNGQNLFEYLGLSKESTETFELEFVLWYTYVEARNLRQRFIQQMKAKVVTKWATIFEPLYSVTVDLEPDVRLKRGLVEPTGSVLFNYSVSNNGGSGYAEFVINGKSLSIGQIK